MVVVGGETESETAATERETAAPLEEAAAQKPDLNDYEQFYTEMAEIADETKRSIVTVTGVTSELDLFNDVSESHSSTAGVIISKTEGTLLILTEKNTISDADSIKVTFEDGSIADGWLQASDEISDLAVVKVFSRELGETTAAYVEAAEFADSGETKIGDPIIALSAGYVSFGMVTAQPYLYLCDGSYQRINTDIIGKNENGGILMNLDGQVVGILGPDTKSRFFHLKRRGNLRDRRSGQCAGEPDEPALFWHPRERRDGCALEGAKYAEGRHRHASGGRFPCHGKRHSGHRCDYVP